MKNVDKNQLRQPKRCNQERGLGRTGASSGATTEAGSAVARAGVLRDRQSASMACERRLQRLHTPRGVCWRGESHNVCQALSLMITHALVRSVRAQMLLFSLWKLQAFEWQRLAAMHQSYVSSYLQTHPAHTLNPALSSSILNHSRSLYGINSSCFRPTHLPPACILFLPGTAAVTSS